MPFQGRGRRHRRPVSARLLRAACAVRAACAAVGTTTALWATLLAGAAASVAMTGVARAAEIPVALVTLADDARYDNRRLEQAYPGHPAGRPQEAIRVALGESEFALQAAGHRVRLLNAEVRSSAEVAQALQGLAAQGVRRFLLDLPADAVRQAGLAAAAADAAADAKKTPRDWMLFNLGAADDALRAEACGAALFHAAPSQQMKADALAQWLAVRKWRNVLLLTGPRAEDAPQRQAFERAAKRFGLKVVAHKPFKLSNDPRERDLANPLLLTAGIEHDVVVVVDSDGEFARTLPYATQLPRPVAGANGLTAEAWHWAWERNGGPQLNRRFMRVAQRRMDAHDWAAWVAAKALVEAVVRQPKGDAAAHRRALRSGEIVIDGFKGPRLSFRAWDGQLRQPVFLAHGNGVAAVAPLEGMLHPQNVLDTLGTDQAESACRSR